MVDSVNSNQAASGATGSGMSGALTGGNTMGKDAFLKLLVAQLRHQDPLKPQDGSEFVAELAQFSSLEQTMAINDRLDMLALQNRGLANTQVAGLVGQIATVRGTMVTSDGTGVGAPVNFTLGGAADKVTVKITNQSGEVVRTIEVGAKAAGFAKVMWDGRNDSGVVQPAGAYQVSIVAKDANDAPVSVEQETSGTVTGVSFDKGYLVLHLDTGVSVPVSDLLKIEPGKSKP